MELPQFFERTKTLDIVDPAKLPQLIADIKSTLDLYATDFSKLGPALFNISDTILRMKDVKNEHTKFYDQLICEVIRIAVKNQFKVGSQSLPIIFNNQCEYYKTANSDLSLNYPLGKDRTLKQYQPKVDEYCEVVRPYISSTTVCGWTRCKVIEIQSSKYILKYENEENQTSVRQKPWFAPLGQRTKDYEWRRSLDVGSPVQALLNRVWYKSTVAQVSQENGCKKVRITFRRFSQQGDKTDSFGNKFFGLSSNEDQWIQILSPRIQMCQKMANKSLCYYSLNAEELIFQDLYDIMFEQQYKEKPFYAIARILICKSASFLTFINQFVSLKGIQVLMKIMDNCEVQDESPFRILSVVGSIVPFLPRMFLQQSRIKQLHSKILPFYQKTIKNLNYYKIQTCYFCFDMIARRVYSLTQTHFYDNQARKLLIVQFLKMNMQKQMLALRYLNQLVSPKKPYTSQEREIFHKFLKDQKIYSNIFNANVHEQIISRAGMVLQYMIKNQIISLKQFEALWTIIPVSDLRGRVVIQKLLTQTSKNIPISFVQLLIQKILSLKQTQLTVDNLGLLRELKNREIGNTSQVNILEYLWNVITVKSVNIKTNIQEQVEKVFKSFVSTLKDNKIRIKVLESMSQKLQQCKKVRNQIQFLKDFIKTYPQKIAVQSPNDSQMVQQNTQKSPQTIFQVVLYLKKRGIYQGLMNLLFRTKQQPIKKDILQFISFLFQYDKEDVNQIIRSIYLKIGPTPNFLQWVNKFLNRSFDFVIQLFQSTTDYLPYQNLNSVGFQALQGMIVQINSRKNYLKIVQTYQYKTQKPNTVAVGPSTPLGPITGDAGKQQDKKQIGPQLPDIKKTIYVLVSPLKLIGINFLLNLLQTVKQTSVYNVIASFTVQLVTNFDQSIDQQIQNHRRQFLQYIIEQIKLVIKQNKSDDRIKSKLQVYVNLIIQIFGQTQRDGIGNLQPYFAKIEGEKILLNINNLFDSDKDKKYKNPLPRFQVQCNENYTLWKLKQIVSKYVNQEPQNVNIIKYSDPMNQNLNGKSLTQLLFYNKEDIKISKKVPKIIPKVDLLNKDKTDVSTQFLNVINSYFNQYKNTTKNGLQFKDVEKLADEKWKSNYFKQREHIQKIFEEYDVQRKGYLGFEDFKRFLFQKANKAENAVWRLLTLSGYKNNLTLQRNQVKQIRVESLPRKIMSNPQVYKLIFQILQNQNFKDVHISFYKLLGLLEVDKSEIEQIQHQIYGIIQKQKSTYALCYSLQVVSSQLAKFSDFYFQFWKNNGIKSIYNRINSLIGDTKNVYQLDLIMKNQIVPCFTRILYLYAYQILYKQKIAKFTSQNKINYLQINQFITKINQFKEPVQTQSQRDINNKLMQIGGVEENLKIIFETATLIFGSIIKGYNNDKVDFLSRLTTQCVRLMTTLVGGKQTYNFFNPFDYFYGIKNPSLNNRRSVIIIIYIYLFYSKEPNIQQIQQVINTLNKQIPIQNKVDNINYFEMLKQIISKYMTLNKDSKEKDEYLINIGNYLLNKLFNQIQGELRSQVISNRIILGILQVIQTLVSKDSICLGLTWRSLQITQKCLFAYNIQQKLSEIQITQEMLNSQKQKQHWKNYVICKTQLTRNCAYNIIIRMHKLSPGLQPNYINNYILPIIKSIRPQIRLTGQKFLNVGLKNYGSTCYMNSMLQVLNSVKPFRNSLMKCQSQISLIKQLKRIFAGLFFSQRLDYGPQKLLTSFVPPINPGIQQDTTQFLNILFDQLQSGLSNTNYRRLLDQIFKGANVAQMICHSCGYKKQNRQQFFCFGVQIDGKFDLQSALQGSYQGQIISDYLCDQCKNRGQTTKRNILSQIPNVMFIHLRRIVFNYDMFVNMKIHTRLEFPELLNIQPYTKQGVQLREKLGLQYMKNLLHNEQQIKKFEEIAQHGKQKDFYKLKLKGIIVHSGSADVGHYFSILPYQKQWRKFDDSRTSYFAASGFQTSCYGGIYTAQQWGSGSSVNAYVLVYEKTVKNPIKIQQENKIVELNYDEIKTYNSPNDYIQFWLDNHYFMLENQLMGQPMGKGFINFLQKIISDCPKSVKKIQILSQIIYKISFNSGLVGQLSKIIFQNYAQIQPSLFYQYVIGDKVRTIKTLLHYQKQVRTFMANYLHVVLLETYSKGQEKVKSDIIDYINELFSLLTTQVAKNWLRSDGYFLLLSKLVHSSCNYEYLWKFFLQKKLISTLIDFVMQKQSPVRINPKNYSLGTKTLPIDFSSGITIISFYIKYTYGFTGKNYQSPSPPQHLLFHLSDNDVICLSHMQFYRKMLKERQCLFELAAIIQRLCIMNLQFSKSVIQVVLQTINSITQPKDQMQDLAYLCLQILKIRDDYWINRAQLMLGYSNPFILNNNLMTTFDEQRYVFSSSIYDVFPIESLLSYSYLYRLKNTIACFYLIKSIIQGCSVSDNAMRYIARLPPPSYLFQSYISWAQYFIKSFASFATNENAVRQRLQLQAQNLMKYVEDVKTYMRQNPEVDYYKSAITGQIINKSQIQKFEKDGIQIKIYEYEVYCLPSTPLKQGGNLSLDPYLDSYRLTKQVSNNSNILKFMKKPAKTIALKLEAVQQQEKQLKQLFPQNTALPIIPIVSTPTQMQTEKPQSRKEEQRMMQQQSNTKSIEMNIEQKKKEVKEQQINLPNVYKCNYYRQLQIKNKTKQKKFIRLSFITQQYPNFIIPSQLSWKIFVNGTESIWIAKQDSNKDWGKMQLKSNVEEYVKQKHQKKQIKSWWFKTYGDKQSYQQKQEPVENGTQMKNQNPQISGGNNNQQTQMGGQSNPDQISCPVCTVFNSVQSTICYVCESPLK